MCLFSDFVEKVSDTQIFARGVGDRQILVYSMNYAARNELAMVLPIPSVADAPEDAVRFLTLEDCPDFFDHLARGFPAEIYAGDDEDVTLSADRDGERTLEVHDVGAYEASFVPSPADFGRLDARFRLPVEIWLEHAEYRDWGFAVFKLKPTEIAAVHPMAFDFPRRDGRRLFFPTLHLHDRRLDKAARYDHLLYCQPEPAQNWHLQGWRDSRFAARDFVRCEPAGRFLDMDYSCWRVALEGQRENRDTWVGPGGGLPLTVGST